MNKKRVEVELKLLYRAIGLIDPGLNRLMVRIQIVDRLSKAFDNLAD
jgi:hypothetical protein